MLTCGSLFILLSILPQGDSISPNLPQNANTPINDICLTPECNRTASEIMEYANFSIKPCDDFYKFSCGNFLKTAIIPEDVLFLDNAATLEIKSKEQLIKLLEEKSLPDEPKPLQLAKTFYQNCKNSDAAEESHIQQMLDTLKKFGEWPVLENEFWNEDKFNWIEFVYKLRNNNYPADYFMTLNLHGVQMSATWAKILKICFPKYTRQLLSIKLPSFISPYQNAAKGVIEEEYMKYFKLGVSYASLLGANITRAIEELKDSEDFAIKLVMISWSPEDNQINSGCIKLRTVKQLSEEYTSIPWKEYLNIMMRTSIRFEDDDLVVVEVPTYLKKLEELLQQTPKRTQANYLFWGVVKYLMNLVGEESEDLYIWNTCIDSTMNHLDMSVNALYTKNFFNEENKKRVIEISNNIQHEFTRILEKVDWLDNKNKKRALKKQHLMHIIMGYHDDQLNNKKLGKFYENLKITPGSYIQSLVNVSNFKENIWKNRLRKPDGKMKWSDYESDINVCFRNYLDLNYIYISVTMLQGFYFNKDRPQYMNYGALGSVIGHEIAHGFSPKGLHYDKFGNYQEWWESEAKEELQKMTDCLIRQYENYTVEEVGLNVNGTATLDENVADHGGFKAAYLAYQKWVDRNGPEPRLPGLNYTPSQLFWISTARMFCTKYKEEVLKYVIASDEHSPSEFRIAGPFSNSPEFAKDFQCPLGSRMNPEKKCSVW